MHRPSIPRALRRTATAAALAAAVTVPIGTQTAALAQTKGAGNGTETAVPAPAQVADCPHSTKKYFNGNAEARLYCRYTNRYEVQGWFHNDNPNYSITGWVEQRSGNGPYRRITFLYPVNASYTAQTGWHEDNFPKQARACFRFSFRGAATHCTDPF